MNMRQAQLPAGWDRKSFGEVLDVLRNGVNCKQDKKGKGEKISRIESISSCEFDVERVGYSCLKEEEKVKYKLEYGDILFSHINSPIHVGKTAIFKSDVEVYHGVNLLLMRPKPFLDKTYFEHYLKYLYQNGYWKGLCKQSVNQASVNQQDINKVDIAYPKSLPEQQRIVSILDKAFSAIEQSRNNAEQNLKNAKELFESYLQGVLEKKGEGWEGKTLGEIAFVKSGGTPLRHKTEYWSGDIAWYSSGELNNLYTKNPERHINKLAIDNSNAKLFPKGSLLIGMYDTAALKMSILDREGTFNQAIAGVKPNPKIDLIFILHSINAIKPEILNLRRGVRQKNLSLEKIKNIPVAIPPLKDQQAIVSQLDALRAETQKLEAIYRQKLAGLEELKKSILQKAFNGGLTGSELAEPMRELETKKAVAV